MPPSKLRTGPAPGGVHAGLLRGASKPDGLKCIRDAVWMPSHRTLASDATDAETFMHQGNDKAGKEAEAARIEQEERVGKDQLQEAEDICKAAIRAIKAIGSILAEYLGCFFFLF